jgi:hypothetical protein
VPQTITHFVAQMKLLKPPGVEGGGGMGGGVGGGGGMGGGGGGMGGREGRDGRGRGGSPSPSLLRTTATFRY